MQTRPTDRLGRELSVVGLGAWQLGGDWGDVGDDDARAVLDAAVADDITVIDTADVYGDGRSERLVGDAVRRHPDAGLTVATKMGRRVDQVPANYTLAAFREWTDRSRANLGVDTLDLVQLHCPPTPVFADDAVYDALDTLVADKRIAAYGVSVETCAEALTAIARPGVASVQIILNCLRLKPLDQVLPAAAAAGVAIIARVPLASGLLSGRYDEHTTFAATTTAPTTGPGRRSTSARRSPASRTRSAWPRSASCARSCPTGFRCPRSPCAGSSTSPASRSSSPARATRTRSTATPRRPTWPRCRPSSSPACATSTTDSSARTSTTAGDRSRDSLLGRRE